ncbi:hypothetical protein FB446DRAFT_763412 [Lentinula raphanica]|uniref:Sulphur transport domain-containing protein n=1 Tax=Lentinula raphanica TaxID=153919 RepID=A0AA38UIM3_9AGAR|nr:hypothetical protein FB446DRAFT_763412 [Lentinula raphanica]KAJ3818795.1 hypothetical protein F5880DRAFT_1597952 [Lentinula raphanica]KAJ3839747.1 hypothetical protein F5878DRAFT_104646 [Lentinula raphanica]
MSTPTPLTSVLGGIGLSLPVYSLMILNGNVFGISGFVHRAVRGNKEAMIATIGLITGGVIVGAIEGKGPETSSLSLPGLLLSGFLVGLGTKLSNGCTSGHMLAGLSRFSKRSIAATAIFFCTAVATTKLLHPRTYLPTNLPDYSLNTTDKTLLMTQTIPLLISVLLYSYASMSYFNPDHHTNPKGRELRPVARLIALMSTTVEFALALRLSNLADPKKVTAFLLLPSHPAFDPSLAFLAIGALPLGAVLYHLFRNSEQAALGGPWAIPKAGHVDSRLVLGSVLFGIGWGTSGLCPGPAVINLGRALSTGSPLANWLYWSCAFVIGGLCVN